MEETKVKRPEFKKVIVNSAEYLAELKHAVKVE